MEWAASTILSSSTQGCRIVINPRNSHSPLPDERRKRCPICRQAVYSPAGIHPQCAIKQADPWKPASPADAPDPAAVAEAPAKVEVKAEKAAPAVAPRPALASKRKVKQA
jgi:hypothetical protein